MGYISGKLVFVRDMIILIKYMAYWSLIRQKNQAKVNKDIIRKN